VTIPPDPDDFRARVVAAAGLVEGCERRELELSARLREVRSDLKAARLDLRRLLAEELHPEERPLLRAIEAAAPPGQPAGTVGHALGATSNLSLPKAPPAGPRSGRQEGGGRDEAAAGPGGGEAPPGHSDQEEATGPVGAALEDWRSTSIEDMELPAEVVEALKADGIGTAGELDDALNGPWEQTTARLKHFHGLSWPVRNEVNNQLNSLILASLPRCRVCGCTERTACEGDGGSCHWVEPDLCSACVWLAEGPPPAETIAAQLVYATEGSLVAAFRLPKVPKKRVEKLRTVVEQTRKDVAHYEAEYRRLAAQWPDGRSEQERKWDEDLDGRNSYVVDLDGARSELADARAKVPIWERQLAEAEAELAAKEAAKARPRKAKAAHPPAESVPTPATDDAPFASPGDVVRTSYGSGPYVVESISKDGERDGRPTYGMTLRDQQARPGRRQPLFLNQYQRQDDGRITAHGGRDELVVLPAGSDGGPTWWEWSRFLESWDISLDPSRPEYREHQRRWMRDALVEVRPGSLINPSGMKAWGQRLKPPPADVESEPDEPDEFDEHPGHTPSLPGVCDTCADVEAKGGWESTVDPSLINALSLIPENTVARNRKSGATDGVIRVQLLAGHWGSEADSNSPVQAPGGGWVRGGQRPAFWLDDPFAADGKGGHKRPAGLARPTLQGPALIARVRRLLHIPVPARARAGKAVRQAIREADRVERAALEAMPADGERKGA
jgi:hypothetical protein